MTRYPPTTLDELWQAAMPRLIPRLEPEEQRAAIVLLRELSRGEPVATADLARALEVSTAEAQRLVSESALRTFAFAATDGRTEGFWGLTTRPTHHRFTVGGRTLWTWCAQDGLFMPELLGETAQIESTDPETGDRVQLTVSPARVESAEPAGLTVSMVEAEAADITSVHRIIATACHFVFFFAERASGEQWVAAHPNTKLLSLDDAFALAKRQNAHWFGQELGRRAHAV